MNRVAVVTGASRGLGATLAAFLSAAGWDLVLTARTRDALEATATALPAAGGRTVALAGSIDDAAHRAAVIEVAERLGSIDLLVNNASELGPSPLPSLAAYDLDALRQVFEVNLVAPLALIQSALPLLAAGQGLVVNISSDAARAGYEGWGGYGASKAALDLASVTLAHELQRDGVAVVAVDPGDMQTQMHQDAFPGEDISDRPLPEVTLPFWAWLLGQDPMSVTGRRFEAQAERWSERDVA